MAEILFLFGVCVCAYWLLNANSSKTVKGTNFKFDRLVPRDSLKIYVFKLLFCTNLLGGYMY